MLKKIFKRAGLGFLLGIVIGNAITMLLSAASPAEFLPVSPVLLEKAGGLGHALLVQSLLSGIYGAVCFAGVTLYDIEKLPLAPASVTHCVLVILAFIPVAFYLGWESGTEEMLIMAGIQLVTYFFIWLIMNAIYSAQVKKLNEIQSRLASGKKNRKS